MRVKYIEQHDIRDCAAACLSMISDYYGLKLPIYKSRELVFTDKTGATIDGIIKGASRIGLLAEGLNGSCDELIDALTSGEIVCPFIAHTISEEGLFHFIVVEKISDKFVYVVDPAHGYNRITIEDFNVRWTGYIINIKPTGEFKKADLRVKFLPMLISTLKGQLRKILAILIMSLFISVIGMSGAYVFDLLIDEFAEEYVSDAELEAIGIVRSDDEGDEHKEWYDELAEKYGMRNYAIVFILVLLLYTVRAWVNYSRGYLILQLSKKIDLSLSLDYYNHLIDMPFSTISNRQTGEYMSRFSDIDTIRGAISEVTISFMIDTLLAIFCGGLLYLINPVLFLITIIVVTIYYIVVCMFRKPLVSSNRKMMESNAVVQSYLKESIDGIETIKATNFQKKNKGIAKEKYTTFVDNIIKNNKIGLVQESLTGTITSIGTVVILWYGFHVITKGNLSMGMLTTFYLLFSYFMSPIEHLIQLQPTIQSARVAIDRLFDVTQIEGELVNDGNRSVGTFEKLTMRNVFFAYGNSLMCVNDVSLYIEKGEKIAIIGESGSGKSTIVKLLNRFYDPVEGEILLNEKPLKEYKLQSLRNSIVYVRQNAYFFTDTVRNNLLIGNNDVSDEELRDICLLCNADKFIDELPLGFDTPLDENGANISGGEKQRLAIVRALVQHPQVLILDEATSQLDRLNEKEILEKIFLKYTDLTCIIISHRINSIKNSDCIYVIKDGKIVEKGRHEQLVENNGEYCRMISLE